MNIHGFSKGAMVSVILAVVMLTACAPQAVAPDAGPAPTLAAANTAPATSSPPASPTATPIPGVQVLPVTSLGTSIPWLPLTTGQEPMSVYYGFNFQKPPFNVVEVRRAFAAAVDREAVAAQAEGFKFRNVHPATTITPSETLGRDLYGDVGVAFDPAAAREALGQAGYASGADFPPTTLVVYTRGEAAPGAYYRIAGTIAAGWKEHLGITVTVDVVVNPWDLGPRFDSNPPDMYLLAYGADVNDPDNFLNGLLHSSADLNYGRFNSAAFDALVSRAAGMSDPAERQLLYLEAERLLTEEEVGVIPLFHTWYYQQL